MNFERLRVAAALIDEHGLARGAWRDDRGGYCTVSALATAFISYDYLCPSLKVNMLAILHPPEVEAVLNYLNLDTLRELVSWSDCSQKDTVLHTLHTVADTLERGEKIVRPHREFFLEGVGFSPIAAASGELTIIVDELTALTKSFILSSAELKKILEDSVVRSENPRDVSSEEKAWLHFWEQVKRWEQQARDEVPVLVQC